MKKSIKSILGIFVVSFLLLSVAKAQVGPDGTFKDETKSVMQRTLEFTNATNTEEIKIEVELVDCFFQLEVKSSIMNGELKIEIYDPTGKKQGSFSVGCQINTKSKTIKKTNINDFIYGKTKAVETGKGKKINSSNKTSELNEFVSGSTSKSIHNPMLGDWIVKFIPSNADGYVIIASRQTKTVK